MPSPNTYSPYPLAYGNEEEMSFRIRGGGEVCQSELAAALVSYQRNQEKSGVVICGRYDSTGGATYVDRFQMERCSPTYTEPEPLATRKQYNEDFAIDIATIIALGRETPGLRVGINRRNADSSGHTFANHNNIAVANPDKNALKAKIWSMVVGHALTKGVIVGAGMCDSHGVHFAQKAEGLGKGAMDAYGYVNSAFRVTKDEGTTRVEFRSGDTNISWDSTLRHIGLDAIALSVAQTPLTSEMGSFFASLLQNTRESAVRLNRIPINRLGDFLPERSESARLALEFQMKMCEIFLSDRMGEFGDQPASLMAIAEDTYHFGELMQRVLKGELTVDVLAKQGSDWAAKLMLIASRLKRDRKDKVRRVIGDSSYRRDDLGYDYMEVGLDGEGQILPGNARVGHGYKLRDEKQYFPTYVDPETVKQAGLTPPSDTRDGLRAALFTEYRPIAAGWHYVTLEPQHPGNKIHISMGDVLMTALSEHRVEDLKEGARKAPKRS